MQGALNALTLCCQEAVRIMPIWFSMLDETGFYAPSMAHNTLPCRPWQDISGFHVHNSTDSKQLRYSLSGQHVYARGVRGLRALRCGKIATNDAA